MRLLIIEDQLPVAELLKAIIEQSGYSVVGNAQTVTDALSLVSHIECDGAVLDIDLSGSSSKPVAEFLHAHNIPFLVVSSHAPDGRGAVFTTAPFVAKPFDINILVETLVSMFGKTGPK